MARFLKGVHGAYSGKVGNVVGSSWRNVDYIRSLPKKSNKPASEAQVEQRAKFAMAVAFISPIKDVVNLGFSDIKQGKVSGYNLAVRSVMKNAISGLSPNYEIAYQDVQISKGPQGTLIGLEMQETAPLDLELTWTNIINRFNAFDDDSVIVLLYNKDDNMFSIFEGAIREEERYLITFPPAYSGKSIVGWAFTGHRDGVKTSNSQYLGEVMLS